MHAPSELRRELRPAYSYRGLVTGWCCSLCQEAFHIPLEQATDLLSPPAEVQEQFNQHNCLRTMADRHLKP